MRPDARSGEVPAMAFRMARGMADPMDSVVELAAAQLIPHLAGEDPIRISMALPQGPFGTTILGGKRITPSQHRR
jgi:hypothetical protein